MTANAIASALQIPVREVYRLRDRLEITFEEMADLDTVFLRMLEGRACPLRSRLSDSIFRANAQGRLKNQPPTNK